MELDQDNIQVGIFKEACTHVFESGRVSHSFLQRRLNIGYAHAARIIEKMVVVGIASDPDERGLRKVIMTLEEYQNKSA